MDGSRFDAWTRRRFGLAAGGVAAALAGLIPTGEDAAAKRKRKKRCRKPGKICTPGGKKCCGKRFCARPFSFPEADRCCKGGGEPCTGTQDPTCCTGDCTPAGECFCKTGGQPCDRNGQCCSRKCSGGTCTGPA